MNFTVYFERLSETDVQPEHRSLQKKALRYMRKKNLTVSQQEKILVPYLRKLKKPEADQQKIWENFKQEADGQAVPAAAEWMDLFLFIFLYSGLYEAGFGCILSPMLDGNGMIPFELGWSSMLQTLWVYLIFKAVFFVMDSDLKKWQRWTAVILLFAAYLGGIYLTRFVPGAVGINPLLWIVITAVPAWLSWKWLQKNGYVSSSV